MKGISMRKQYDQNVALSLINRMKNGEKINDLSKETGVPRTTLWRWKKGISFPASGISKNYPEYYRKNKKEIIERIKKNRYDGKYFGILKRDEYRCVVCNHKSYLKIHHRDGNRDNNAEGNLVTVCHRCHRIIHWSARVLNRIPPYDKIYEMVIELKS
jgi:hypothetical protein